MFFIPYTTHLLVLDVQDPDEAQDDSMVSAAVHHKQIEPEICDNAPPPEEFMQPGSSLNLMASTKMIRHRLLEDRTNDSHNILSLRT